MSRGKTGSDISFNRITSCSVEKTKAEEDESSYEVTEIIQAREDGSLSQTRNNGDDRRLISESVLKVEPTEFAR